MGQVAEALVNRMLNPLKMVQIATCSAFGVFVEATGGLMVPYIGYLCRRCKSTGRGADCLV